MDAYVWDENFTTGLTLVDEQQHRLVDLVNRLGGSLIDSQLPTDSPESIFSELAEYASYHTVA